MKIEINLEELRKKKLFVATPMYGGMCQGMYMKSCLDLQSVMSQYGVECKFSFIFNESLISRARSYCADEFLTRSDCTHMLFIDADIVFNAIDVIAMLALDREILGSSYPKKCCPANTIIETEDGPKKIKWIVDNKYSGKVLCVDENLKFVWRNVIDHINNGSDKTKKWVIIGKGGSSNSLVVTEDHLCSYIDNIFNPIKLEYTEARNMAGKYIARQPKIGQGNNRINPLYGKDQISFLIGTMIGDGSIRKGYLGFGYSDAQREYIELKQKLFGGKLGGNKKVGSYKGKDYFASFLDCPRNAQINELENLMYKDESGNKCKKTLKNVISMLDEKGLAFLYLDDGSLCNVQSRGSIMLHTNGFDLSDIELLQQHLLDTWNIDSNIIKRDKYDILRINTENSEVLFGLISKYVPDCMEYKLPVRFRGGVKYNYDDVKCLDIAAQYIDEARDVVDNYNCNKHYQPRTMYDITVEEHHNFVANSYVVHNCINWEQLHKAIQRNPELPASEYEKLTGSMVFNPVKGSTQFTVTEPVEIMDLGTGFTMYKREVFEKFQEAHPEQMFRPDHQTEHFNSSREICAFFDCKIDPESKRYLSEDYYFTQECRKLGIKTWMCPWIELQHVGTYFFKGSFPAVAKYIGSL